MAATEIAGRDTLYRGAWSDLESRLKDKDCKQKWGDERPAQAYRLAQGTVGGTVGIVI